MTLFMMTVCYRTALSVLLARTCHSPSMTIIPLNAMYLLLQFIFAVIVMLKSVTLLYSPNLSWLHYKGPPLFMSVVILFIPVVISKMIPSSSSVTVVADTVIIDCHLHAKYSGAYTGWAKKK